MVGSMDSRKGGRMTTGAVVFMILVLGIVWGGFAFSLAMALRKEKKKRG